MLCIPSRGTRASPIRICVAVGVVPYPAHRASLALQLTSTSAPPKHTAHSPLSVSPPRRAPFMASLPTPSAPTHPRLCTVEVRADPCGLSPARVVCLRGRGYGYGYRPADGMEQRWHEKGKGERTKMGRGRRPRERCAALPNLVLSSVGDSGARFSRLGCASVCGCADCEEERGPGPQT
ncbi:hypothetical protein B0H14DRAFT_3053547, partial [Mycena olivaceomarginata]